VVSPGLLITTASPLTPGQINQPYTAQLAASGGIGAPYIWSATGLPSGLTIANNSGLIAGIPRAAGNFTVAVTVGDFSGSTVTQNYTLAIASASLTFSSSVFSNGAVGSSYSSTVSVTGGAPPYTYTAPATSLPPGLTLAATGTLGGTPTTAGTYTFSVAATDAAGATASASFTVTIAAQVVVTATSIPTATAGVGITPVQLTATGGTPPYQWQSASLPPGLSLALNGTLSGTPTAAGTFQFTVYTVDSSGALASGSEQLVVGLPAAPSAAITGASASSPPSSQQFVTVSLASAYTAPVTANLTLTFTPASGADDPNVQFIGGGRTAQVQIPAGDTSSTTNVGVQIGTVAGTITITAQLAAGGANITPTPAPTTTIMVPAAAPVITAVTATRTTTGFTVSITGYASNKDVDSSNYTFTPSAGSSLSTSTATVAVTPLFTQWYTSAGSPQYGSEFTLSQPFTVSGSASSVLSLTVTLSNALGTSQAVSAILH
jgi:hypothetical protein